MKICLKCENIIPKKIEIDGKIRNLDKRKYCLDCSPFGSHNTRPIHQNISKIRICKICDNTYDGGHRKRKDLCNKCASIFYRTQTKQQAIDYKGGKCSVCGYNKYMGSLHFHHVYPETKSHTIAQINFRKFELIVDELDKCILVCSNCHGEIHAGLIDAVEIYEEQLKKFPKYIKEVKPEKFYKPIIKISKRPDKEILEKLVWEMPCVKIGEMFGVSDNAVNKWCKFYGIKKPGRGDWEKIKSDKLDKPSD